MIRKWVNLNDNYRGFWSEKAEFKSKLQRIWLKIITVFVWKYGSKQGMTQSIDWKPIEVNISIELLHIWVNRRAKHCEHNSRINSTQIPVQWKHSFCTTLSNTSLCKLAFP